MIERPEYGKFAEIAHALADKQMATTRNKVVLVMAHQLGAASEIIQELLIEIHELKQSSGRGGRVFDGG